MKVGAVRAEAIETKQKELLRWFDPPGEDVLLLNIKIPAKRSIGWSFC
jgi:hypothetical protein